MNLPYHVTGVILTLAWIVVTLVLWHWGFSDFPSREEKNIRRVLATLLIVVLIAIINLLVNYQ